MRAASLMLMAALVSACASCPQAWQTKAAWLLRFSFATCPQEAHIRLVFRGSTRTSNELPSLWPVLSASRCSNLPQQEARMARFSPAFALAPLERKRPGLASSGLAFGFQVMLLVGSASTPIMS